MIAKQVGVCHGAIIEGINLSKPLREEEITYIREAWLKYHVICFPEQKLTMDQLLRFSRYFGQFGEDPFIAPIQGRKNILAIQRRATEKTTLFAENWHSDWSFQKIPPAGTCLYGIKIPPVGGDTLFADQQTALHRMPIQLRKRIDGKFAIHSAKLAYSPDGLYGEPNDRKERSMDINPSVSAHDSQIHSLVIEHPESKVLGLFGCLGYIVGIQGMTESESFELLSELLDWQTRPEFIYRHRWEPGMLVLWDNRCVLHRATGGYDGHDRYLLRTTIASAKY